MNAHLFPSLFIGLFIYVYISLEWLANIISSPHAMQPDNNILGSIYVHAMDVVVAAAVASTNIA